MDAASTTRINRGAWRHSPMLRGISAIPDYRTAQCCMHCPYATSREDRMARPPIAREIKWRSIKDRLSWLRRSARTGVFS